MFRLTYFARTLCVVMVILGSALSLQAQTPPAEKRGEMPVRISAELKRVDSSSTELIIHARIADGFHIYAQSQPKPFLATRIEIDASSQLKIAGAFQADRKPKIQRHPALDVELHEFEHGGNGAASIPFYAVFPAGRPHKPITFDGVFTSPQPVVDALKTAGPSRAKQTIASQSAATTRAALPQKDI